MTRFDFDLFVVGAGSGGVRAARTAAQHGVNVGIAENRYLGGTCVNVGCVPKKLFVYAAQFGEEFRAAKGFGWTVQKPQFDWSTLMAEKNREIGRLQGIYEELLVKAGVRLFSGNASLLDEHTLTVGGQIFSSDRILIATGGWPFVPDIPGREYVLTSNEMFGLERLPESLLIVGGGYIAVEFAGIMQGLGVATTICYRGDKLLRGFDEDIRDFIGAEMQKKGIDMKLNTDILSVNQQRDGLQVTTDRGCILEAGQILYATGRMPNVSGLGLEKLGVALDENGAIKVNRHYQSNVPSIYAVGDVTHQFNLTPVATAEAMALINRLYTEKPMPVDYEQIPTAVFSQPEVGTVGLTEAEARNRYDDIAVYRSVFTPMKHTLSGIKEKTLMKLVVRRETDQVLGVHMVGTDAGEIIQGMAVALRAGATKAVFDSTIGIHPTSAEEFVTMRVAAD